ncbi:MAG: TonB-dependent receptor [Hyphomonadaceae bacterium]
MTRQSMRTKLLATTLLVGMSGSVWASAAVAQDTSSDDPVVISETDDEDGVSVQERVVVTGSRLRRPVDTTIAVTTIGADQIERRGFTNVVDAIEELPLAGLGTNLEGATLGNNDSTANPNLLGLGTNRTLTLVNGRRFVSSNQASVFVPGNANGAQVDLTLINPALIANVDAVAGSAGGATYGADAVGGVINLTLIDDYDGYEVDAQYGVTNEGDGQTFRFSGVAGKNFLNDRANITFAAEYNDINSVNTADASRLQGQGFTTINNPLAGAPGVPTTLILPGGINPFNNTGGVLVGGQTITTSTNNAFFPTGLDAALPGGVFSPFDFAQTALGQTLDPLALIGSNVSGGSFLTIPNTDPATSAFLPNVAVPLQFDSNGNLVPLNLGDISPPGPSDQNTVFGDADGIQNGSIDTIRGAQERISLTALTRFDITNDITYKAEYYYANIENSLIDGFQGNNPTGSTAAGTRSVPVFIDENPFLNDQATGVINDLVANGLVVDDIGGSRALFLSRALVDVLGPIDETSETDFYRTTQEIGGDFNFLERDLYWNTAFNYGRVERDNAADTILDVEFALAVDAVEDANGNIVCRQQTLAAPEPIADRNPQVGFINTALPTPVTPTQAQIDACVPLNLFGEGAPSQAAIDFVSSSTDSRNVSEQFQYTAEFGGDAIDLPGGTAIFNTQFEWRREENEFLPGDVFADGTGRATVGQPSSGNLEFLEGGLEVSIPILGEGFNFFGAKRLEFDGAVRVVSRTGGSDLIDSERVTDVVYNVGGRYSPFDWLTVRGSQSTSVRSPSVVELFGAGVTGFSTAFRGNGNPCDVDVIDGGPEGGIRRTNCEAAVAALGLPADFLDGFQAEGGAAPAAGASNPLLNNEESSTWTVGFVLQPDFVPGFTLTADYYNVDLDDTIQLTSISAECFDQPTFPVSLVNGLNACNAVLIGVPDPANPGAFIVPSVNPFTGDPVTAVTAGVGNPAQTNEAFNSTFAFFDTINQAAQRLQSVNVTARYGFALEDAFGPAAAKWGNLDLSGTLYWTAAFNTFTSAAAVEGGLNNPIDGEPGNPEFSSVFNATHNVGNFSHNVQWLRTSSTAGNVLIEDTSTQNAAFLLPSFNLINYNASYQINDNIGVRFVVNNVGNRRLDSAAGVASSGAGEGDAVGRSFIFGINARF